MRGVTIQPGASLSGGKDAIREFQQLQRDGPGKREIIGPVDLPHATGHFAFVFGQRLFPFDRRRERYQTSFPHRAPGCPPFGSSFPYGTPIVNLLGCGIAAVTHIALTLSWPPTLRSAVTIGFIGGLTTYSSFNDETTRLIDERAHGPTAVNTIATIVGSSAAGWLGLMVAKQLLGR